MKLNTLIKKNTATKLTISFILLMFGFSTAWAGPNEGRQEAASSTSSAKTPDLGVAHLSAVVKANGELVRGSGAIKAVHLTSFLGDYIVTFNRNVRNCTYTTSIGKAGFTGVPHLAVISATGANVSEFGVYIDINDLNGFPAKRPFHLNVFCHQ